MIYTCEYCKEALPEGANDRSYGYSVVGREPDARIVFEEHLRTCIQRPVKAVEVETALSLIRELFRRTKDRATRLTRYVIRLSSRVTQLEKVTIDRFNKTLNVLENHQSSIEIHAREIKELKNALRQIGADSPIPEVPLTLTTLCNTPEQSAIVRDMNNSGFQQESKPYREPGCMAGPDCAFCKSAGGQRKNKLGTTYGALAR